MLEPDPMKRITMAGVKIHPWMSTPLQPEYEKKWRQLQQQEEMKTQQVEEMIKALDQSAVRKEMKLCGSLLRKLKRSFSQRNITITTTICSITTTTTAAVLIAVDQTAVQRGVKMKF
jgi:hypothetical protein